MSTNVATIIGGPCLILRDGAIFRSKGDVGLDLSLDTFDIVTDLYQAVDKRVSGQPIKITFTPEGRWSDLPVLYPYATAALGSLVTPVRTITSVDPATDTLALVAHGIPPGLPVSFGTTGVMPAGLVAPTLYYLGAPSVDTLSVHTSAAAAIAGTGDIDITTAGTGTLKCVTQKTLVIIGNDGTRVTFHNSAITKMPSFTGASTETVFGDVEFQAFSKNGVPWATAGSFYTIDTAAFSDSGFDPADIITQPYALTWGAAPWAGIYTKKGVTVDFAMGLEPVEDDASGILTYRFSSLAVTAKAQPMGPDLDALMTALKLQGAGAVRGRSLAGSDLNIVGTGIYVRLYAAALTGGPAVWSSKNDRIGELTWASTRSFTAGVANPLFFVGTGAPA
jgi:hypothetical protein